MAGFKILESLPIAHLDGMYHDKLATIKFRNNRFIPSKKCLELNEKYKKIPFFHNHMHLLIIKKDL